MVREMVQLLQGQNKHQEAMTSALQTISTTQEKQAWALEAIQVLLSNVEVRTSKNMCSPVDAFRHVGQEAIGEIWGGNAQCYRVVAQMLQFDNHFSRGHLPVFADIARGQFYAAKAVLQVHNLLAEDEQWQDGNVACALPSIQRKLIFEAPRQNPPLTAQFIDQLLGITPAIREEIDLAIASAMPRRHDGDQNPVEPDDGVYRDMIHQMMPAHAIGAMHKGRFRRP